ncbi:MAG: hypothetical protein U9P44_00195, partial [archaeon]|nr:hypothetical protein [archaeon]
MNFIKMKGVLRGTQLSENIWIAGGYYVDFDSFGQFRIIGPNNHLYCGLVGILQDKVTIDSVKERDNILTVIGRFNSAILDLPYPAMDDVRTMRKLVDHTNTFFSLRFRHLNDMVPHTMKETRKDGKIILKFRRKYGYFFYETAFEFGSCIEVRKTEKPTLNFRLGRKEACGNIKAGRGGIPFSIVCSTNDLHFKKIRKLSMLKKNDFDFELFGRQSEFVKYVLARTEIEIKHLLQWGKTSGDRFGTVFPRDWMESADLGFNDLLPEVREYMYEASLKNVNKKGEGWHEDIVGECKYRYNASGKECIDRKMIDIEPRYLMVLDFLPRSFLFKKGVRERLKRVAKYVIENSRKNDFIVFKETLFSRPEGGKQYYQVGNWRDSEDAFKKVHKIIAPFDVNAVFYPTALLNIKKYQNELGLSKKDVGDIDNLIEKWSNKKENYLFRNPDGRIAYALALYDIKKMKDGSVSCKRLEVNNLDESYLYSYCDGTQEEIKSFCERLLDPDYFYTRSGPLLTVGNDNYSYTSEEYHGKVIWIKQTAFAVMGLSRHLKMAKKNNWPPGLQKLIKKTILKTTKNIIYAVHELNDVPELYVD